LATKKLFQLSKELGVDSKAIVAKCQAEGIPESVIKNHMSPVSAGLEATIREWFSGEHAASTAIETSGKVDLEKVKKSPRSRGGKSKASAEDADAGSAGGKDESSVAVADKPTAAKPVKAAKAKAPPASVVPAPTTFSPVSHAPVQPLADEHAKATRIEPSKIEPPKPKVPAPAARADEPKQPGPAGDGGAGVKKPAAPVPPQRPVGRVAPVNVPTRPTVVTPAGPRLENRAPVKLAGPKVVRVEAPEQVEAPRPRRAPVGGGSSGGSGVRSGGGVAGRDDDRNRSPRRKDAGPGGGNKRSSGAGVPERRRGRSDQGGAWTGTGGSVFSEQDLLDREARLARASGFLKKRKQELTRSGQPGAAGSEPSGKIKIAAPFTLKDLSAATGVKASEISKRLFMQGIMLKINDPMPVEKAIEVMMDFDIELETTAAQTAEEAVSERFLKREVKDLRPRGAVVTILGHVDHGKTSLLDKIRNANVAAGEAGGITQKTSAFVSEIEVEGAKKQVVFLDTPGHEAFTGMRARGAKITDVVVLVVSAPEGVMPQTVESINHAKAAGVPIVVALNKIDRPDATDGQIQKTLGQLAGAGVNTVEWGGEVESVRVSATTGAGIPKLLEILDLQAGVLDLKADFAGPAQGTVIEAKMEEGRGAVASVLVQQGELKVGDFIVLGRAFGRVRDITDDKGKRIKSALPPMPVQISGISEVCDAGDKFYVATSLKHAEEAADQRRQRERHAALAQPKVTLDSLFSQMQQAQQGMAGAPTPAEPTVKEIKIVLKTDQQGTVDVLKGECEKVKSDEIRVRVIDAAVGGITESNVLLADASKAIVIGFNVIPSGKARQLAEQKGVEIRTYQVIYDIVEDLKKAVEGMLAPDLREEVLGHADVRAVFKVSKVGSVAGCYVTDGTVQRDALIRVTRNGVVIEHDRKLSQLKRMKDDAKEVRSGLECGMKIDGYDDIKEGDVLECYRKVEVKRTL
jgi:translation initiation factor IF-2